MEEGGLMINAKLTLLTSPHEIQTAILKALKDELNKLLIDRARGIERKIKQIVFNAITHSPEYQSLIGGKLQSELGVPNSESKIYRIVAQWISNIHVSVVKLRITGGKLSGGLHVRLMKDKYADVLSLPEASYQTQRGVIINWLQWLLIEGDKMIVRDYHVGYVPNARSRTNLGEVMIKGGTWRVPPEFSGTPHDNFVTRSLESASVEIDDAIRIGLTL
jgi:hypothetical protein